MNHTKNALILILILQWLSKHIHDPINLCDRVYSLQPILITDKHSL